MPDTKEVKSWYIYMARSRKGALYTGITTDVRNRIRTHNDGRGSKSLKALGLPVKLVYSELVGSKSGALKREAEIKRWDKSRKEAFLLSTYRMNNKTTIHPNS